MALPWILLTAALVGWGMARRRARLAERLATLSQEEAVVLADVRRLEGIVEGHRSGRSAERARVLAAIERMLADTPKSGHRLTTLRELRARGGGGR